MSRDYKLHLEDIREAGQKIGKYVSKMDRNAFEKDDKTIDAVVKNLEIIGEAVKKLPESVKTKYPDVEWKKMAGLRDILIHEYFGISLEIVWDIVQNKLPILEKQIKKILSE